MHAFQMSASSSLKRRPFAPPRPPFESAVDARANEPNGAPPLLSALAVKSSRNTPSSSRVRASLVALLELYDDVTSTCDYHVTLRYIGRRSFAGWQSAEHATRGRKRGRTAAFPESGDAGSRSAKGGSHRKDVFPGENGLETGRWLAFSPANLLSTFSPLSLSLSRD